MLRYFMFIKNTFKICFDRKIHFEWQRMKPVSTETNMDWSYKSNEIEYSLPLRFVNNENGKQNVNVNLHSTAILV